MMEVDAYAMRDAPAPQDLLDRTLHAMNNHSDNLCRYASTVQGAAALSDAMDALLVDGSPPDPEGPTSQACEQYHEYAQALSFGAQLHARAKVVGDDVKAGRITGADAAAITQYPSAQMLQNRQDEKDARHEYDRVHGPLKPSEC